MYLSRNAICHLLYQNLTIFFILSRVLWTTAKVHGDVSIDTIWVELRKHWYCMWYVVKQKTKHLTWWLTRSDTGHNTRIRATTDQFYKPLHMEQDVAICHLHDFKNRRLEDAEECRILGVLGPAYNLTPVLCVGFLLPGSGKDSHVIFGDTAEDEEWMGEDTRISRHRHVNCSSNLARREEPTRISNILMLRKFMNVRTSKVFN